LDKSLYAAGPDAYIGVMHNLSARALLIGHNPGLEPLVELLTGEIHLMSICSLAHVKLPVDKWSDIDNKIKGKVAAMWQPRDLT
jgi:phosphohistidine phosphatase